MERAPIFAFLTFQYFLHTSHHAELSGLQEDAIPKLSELQATQYHSCQNFRGHNTTAVRTSGDTIPQLSELQGTQYHSCEDFQGTQYHSCQNFRGHNTTAVRTSGDTIP
jgi:hypothetical protein